MCLFLQKPACQNKPSHFINEYSLSVNDAYEDSKELPSQPGFGAGIFHVHEFNSFFALLTGLEYNNTHFYSKYDQHSPTHEERDVTYSLNYMSVPLELRLSFFKKIKIFIEGGVYFENYILAFKEGTLYSYNPFTREETTNNFHHMHLTSPISYGFIAGIGFQVPIGKHAILIKPAVTYGSQSVVTIDSKKFYNRYAKISIVWKL